MDEEGTVAYFKTSPSAQNAEEELKFEDEGHDVPFTDTPPMPGMSSSSALPQGSLLGRAAGYFKRLIMDTYSPDKQLMCTLSGSVLLTEEDSQILYFSLKHSPILPSTPGPPNRWFFYCCPVLVAIVAISLYLAFSSLIVISSISVAILGAVWTMLCKYKQNRTVSQWSNYSIDCEELLSLLTKTLRLIQETEVLSRGYSRPLTTVPVSRLEYCEGSKLQCLPLRKRLLQLCGEGLLILRVVTRKLCSDVTTVEELDSVEGYLAYKELKSLHPYMEARDETQRDDEYTHEQLSLESLKDACNLFAVQNSEFVRRLALVVGLAKVPSKVALFENCLREVLSFVSKARRELEWSLQYQKDFLFGEPPTRATKQVDELRHHQDLQPFINEVHLLDLKLQLALQRTRDLGALLTERYLNEIRPSEEEVLELLEKLSVIESDLDMSSEHINESTTVLTNIISSTQREQTDPAEITPSPSDIPEVSKEAVTSKLEDLSEEEDVVFEAYIPPDAPDYPPEEEWEPITDEERQRRNEAKEVPAHLLRELNSVLAVRNDAREKRRQAKRTKRLAKQQIFPIAQDSVIHKNTENIDITEARHTSIIEIPTTESIVKGEDLETVTNARTVTSEDIKMVVTNEEDTKTASEEPLFRCVNFMTGLEQSSLAQAVAAVALKQRQQAEEFFEEH